MCHLLALVFCWRVAHQHRCLRQCFVVVVVLLCCCWVPQLPALEQVTLACKPLVTFKFTQANTPQLRVISANHVGEFRAFDLDLPHLVHLSFEFSTASILNSKHRAEGRVMWH